MKKLYLFMLAGILSASQAYAKPYVCPPMSLIKQALPRSIFTVHQESAGIAWEGNSWADHLSRFSKMTVSDNRIECLYTIGDSLTYYLSVKVDTTKCTREGSFTNNDCSSTSPSNCRINCKSL